MYTVKLAACGNIDHFENPYENIVNGIEVETRMFQGNTIEECQTAVRDYIDEFELGGNSWDGGFVYQDGVQVGYISYNGRYWDKDSEHYTDEKSRNEF